MMETQGRVAATGVHLYAQPVVKGWEDSGRLAGSVLRSAPASSEKDQPRSQVRNMEVDPTGEVGPGFDQYLSKTEQVRALMSDSEVSQGLVRALTEGQVLHPTAEAVVVRAKPPASQATTGAPSYNPPPGNVMPPLGASPMSGSGLMDAVMGRPTGPGQPLPPGRPTDPYLEDQKKLLNPISPYGG